MPKDKKGAHKPKSQGQEKAGHQYPSHSEEEREQAALKRKATGLIGDTAKNHNLTGSTTWETLPNPDQENGQPSKR
jgi:hypothetical protein